MSGRLIHTAGRDRAAPLMVAKVYRLPHGDGFLVKFFKDGTKHRPAADYETDDRDDAIGTADESVRGAHA